MKPPNPRRLFLLFFVFSLLCSLVLVVRCVGSSLKPRPPRGELAIPERAGSDHISTLEQFHEVAGAGLLRARLSRRAENGFTSKGTRATENLLFYHPQTRRAYWLLPVGERLILEDQQLSAAPSQLGDARVTQLALYTLVETDTDGDGKLTRYDRRTLAASSPRGERLLRLNEDLGEVVGTHFLADGTCVVLYTSAGQLHVAEIDPASLAVRYTGLVAPSA